MVYFRKSLKHNIKKKLICYEKKLNSQNSLIKATIELDNKLYKLGIEISYSNPNSKVGFYLEYTSYYNKKLKINRQPNNTYKTILIE